MLLEGREEAVEESVPLQLPTNLADDESNLRLTSFDKTLPKWKSPDSNALQHEQKQQEEPQPLDSVAHA